MIAGIDVDALIRLMPDRRPFEELFERIGEPQPRYYRYTVNAVLRRAGVPEALQQDLYFTHAETAATPEDVHHVQRLPLDDEHELLSIGALFPARRVDHQPAYLDAARGRTIATLQPLLPFLHDHLVLLDSPHDGLEPHSPSGLDVSRGLQRRGPQTMPALYRFPVTSALDMCALPVRSPIRRLLMCNRQVVPALGAEGQLLTACSVARIASQLERRRIWFQRRSWTAMQV